MLFDLHPKESRKELFGRDEEYRVLEKLLESEWVVVLGGRMVGKTSLVKTFAKEHDGIYVNLSGVRSFKDFVFSLASQVGYFLKDVGLNLKFVEFRWSRLADDVFLRLESRKFIVLDEVQYVSSVYFLRLLKRIWDTYPDIRMIFTGSMVGVINKLLNPSSSSPLYGRRPAVLVLKPFSRELSKKFLYRGFSEFGMRISDDEVDTVTNKLDGYPGWLAYYGNFRCVRGFGMIDALNSVLEEGSKIFKDELEHFLTGKNRDIYVRILRILADGGARWSELKDTFALNSKVLNDVLKNLVDAMFVSKENGYYYIADPILKNSIKSIKF
ncbi:MAG: AAA family ATPase [Thermoprotei archaeon]|jgi:AAA+ ATPase superfamily predicted ATPase